MAQLHFATLESCTLNELTAVFNRAFAQYFIPIQLTHAQLQQKIISEYIDLTYSGGMFDGDRLVAFILNGIDYRDGQLIAYNGGTGVLPEYRGRGLTTRVYQNLWPKLQQKGVEKLRLEVITQNHGAIHIYQQLGFRNLRTLDCYRGQKKANQNVSGLELRKLPLAAIESLAQQVDWPPTWQNDLRAVAQQVEHHFSVGAFIEEQLGAFLVGRLEKNRVLQFFVLPHLRRRGIGTALFGQMSGSTPLALINVDQSDQAVAAFLKHLGLSVFLQQYEMECSL